MRDMILMWLLIFPLLSGCAGIGPATVSRDRFDYTEAISDSWKRQMLFNLVKIRYGDAPVFLDVSSVISQYQFEWQLTLGATMEHNPWSHSETMEAYGNYVDRPTITYTPLIGNKFARSLMAPIPPAAVLSLIQTGYPSNLVFRLLVQEINGIRNRFGGEARSQSADPAFYPLLEKMHIIQSAGGIGMRVTKNDKDQASTLIIMNKRDKLTDALSEELRQILKLDPHDNEFNVVYGTIFRNDKEIAILTRSFLEVLIDLSADIQVPALHVEEKRVSPTRTDEAVTNGKVQPLIRILSSSKKPQEAFTLVPYRKFYFWIDDCDLMSKNIFSFLMFVSTLVETGDKGFTPIVTVPTN